MLSRWSELTNKPTGEEDQVDIVELHTKVDCSALQAVKNEQLLLSNGIFHEPCHETMVLGGKITTKGKQKW